METSAITYAEVQGAPPFDWNRFLNKPRRSAQEWEEAFDLAGRWVTCACGNQCAALPRDEYGVPVDYHLRRLGMQFAEAITDRHKNTALEILEEIEARTTALLFPDTPVACPYCEQSFPARAFDPDITGHNTCPSCGGN